MSITKEEFEAAIADLKTAFVEALSPVIESVSILAEAAAPAEEAEVVEGEAEEAEPAIDPVDLAAKLNESGLPKIALTRVVEALKAEANTKTADEIIADEKAYVAQVSESAAATSTAATYGVIEEASTNNTPAELLDAIVGRIAGK
jgi:hypothetical protein